MGKWPENSQKATNSQAINKGKVGSFLSFHDPFPPARSLPEYTIIPTFTHTTPPVFLPSLASHCFPSRSTRSTSSIRVMNQRSFSPIISINCLRAVTNGSYTLINSKPLQERPERPSGNVIPLSRTPPFLLTWRPPYPLFRSVGC